MARAVRVLKTKYPTPHRPSQRASAKQSTFLGMPGSWRWPGWEAAHKNGWNTDPDAQLFPPKVWGYGWSFNFAYPTIKTKPLWARIGAFIIGLFITLLILWAFVCLSVVIYYVLTKSA